MKLEQTSNANGSDAITSIVNSLSFCFSQVFNNLFFLSFFVVIPKQTQIVSYVQLQVNWSITVFYFPGKLHMKDETNAILVV